MAAIRGRRGRSKKRRMLVLFVPILVSLILFMFTCLTKGNEESLQVGVLGTNSPTHQAPSMRFVLFLGIEGTGHHFWLDLVKESPAFQDLQTLGLHPRWTGRLQRNLYRHKKSHWKGIWSAPCKWNDEDPDANITTIHEDLVDTLAMMSEHARNATAAVRIPGQHRPPVLVPVNLLPHGNEFGVISYPGFLKPCRTLQYPNLDVWYRACDQAGVVCEHVYLFRDPYAVLRSTVDNRPINKHKLEAIHLYTTQLRILHSQLVTFPRRLAGCWDYDQVGGVVLSDQTQEQSLLAEEPSCLSRRKDDIQSLLGFPSPESFLSTLRKSFQSKPPLTQEMKKSIVPLEFHGYMESMVRMHHLLVETCSELWEKRKTNT